MLDYRSVLVKYMRYLLAAEGSTLLIRSGTGQTRDEEGAFTPDEWSALLSASAEAGGEGSNPPLNEGRTMREIWLAQQNADLTEGRGPMVTKGVFSSLDEAEKAAARISGVQGVGFGEVVGPVLVWDSAKEWEADPTIQAAVYWAPSQDVLRKRALAKLTPEERKALGFQ